MDMYVRLAMDDEGPVVVKSAAAGAQDRLRAEVERLSRAVHPGVVTVVGSSVDPPRGIELRTRFAGEPVSAWTGTVANIAGLGAAVAATVADLHGIGIVHGRIDEGHVLVGDDGRPRLCGFSSPGQAEPADDVAGLATVLLQLLDRASPPPGRRWSTRRPRSDERAFRQVLDRAVDPIASRRPTALALADAILRAVPSADLPSPPDAAPDTLDRIWSAAEQGTEAERWARALGDGPPDLPTDPVPSPPPSSPVPLADVPTPAWPTAGPSRLDAHTAADARRKLDDASRGDGAEPGPRASNVPRTQADRATSDDTATVERPHLARRGDLSRRIAEAADSPSTERPSLAGQRGLAGRGQGDPTDGAGLTLERPHLAGRGGLGGRARPVEAEVEPPPEPRRSRGVVVGVAMVAVVAVGAGVLALRARGEVDSPSSGPPPPPPGCPAVAAPAADVDGDGCPEALAVDGATVTAGPVQWTLGEPGDMAAVGDWDCDGQASAALLRPRTGDVFAFPAWAESGSPVSVQPIERVGEATGIRARTGDDGCDELVVDVASGTARSVEVPS